MAYLARTFKTPVDRIRPHAKFARLGMDSAASVFFLVELEEWLGGGLPTEIVFAHQRPLNLPDTSPSVICRSAARQGGSVRCSTRVGHHSSPPSSIYFVIGPRSSRTTAPTYSCRIRGRKNRF